MHSVLITNPDGKILLSRYFETQQDGSEYAFDAAENAAGLDRSTYPAMRDRATAMRSSESEVLSQTRHLWTKGTAECPQVARAKVWHMRQESRERRFSLAYSIFYTFEN